MKKELKISTLSIVCVLCAAAVMPAFGAASVRSLGGGGAYNSVSSATAAKTNAVNTTRNSSVRATGGATKKSSSTSGADSSRAAATSRLSIGKYLGGSTAISGGSSVRPGGSTGGSDSGSDSGLDSELVSNLSKDVDQIRKDIDRLHDADDDIKGRLDKKQDGLKFPGDKVVIDDENNVTLDMAALEADLALLFGVKMELQFVNDVIQYKYETDRTWTDLVDMKKYATADALTELENKINDIVPTKLSQLENDAGYLKSGDLATVEKAVEELQTASEKLADDIADLQSNGAGSEVVSQLQQDTASLKSQVESLTTQLDNVATKEDVEGFITSVEFENAIKDMATKSDIEDLVSSGEFQTEIAKLATKGEIADFVTSSDVTSAISGLQTADQVSQAIKDAASSLATKQELADAKSELQAAIDNINAGQVELTNYYTKTQTNEILADYAKSSDLIGINEAIDANKVSIGENAADITALESSVASAASEAADANLAAANAASVATAAQSTADAAKTAAASAQNMADSNAEELAKLATVAKTGSYNDLLDQPTLITQDDLTALRNALETQIDAKADAGDVATADALQGVSDSLAELKDDSYTKAEIDQKIADAVSGGEIDLSGFATVVALNETKAALEAKDTELSNGLTALTNSLTGYVKTSELAPVAISGQYSDLDGAPDMTQYVTTSQVENTVETAMNSYEIPDGSITASKIQAGAITSDKINTEMGKGEMVMLMSNGDGTSSWVAVTVDAE